MNFRFRLAIYSLIILSFCTFRYYLDKDGVFISSDGEIKLYQSYGHYQNGFTNFECFYPAKEIDPNYKLFIFDYPFAFFEKFKNLNCVYQYPPLFSYIGTIFLILFGLKSIMYVSLLFYLLCILVFDQILDSLGVSKLFILIGTSISFTLGIFPLSMLDFSEMSFYHFFGLLILLLFRKLFYNSKEKVPILSFGIGFLIIFTFFIRSEIALFICILGIFTLLFARNEVPIVKILTFLFLGSLVPLIGFLLFNYYSVEYPLGMRTFTVLNDTTSRTGITYHLKIAKGFLWGDEEMVGILKAFPAIIFSFILLIPVYFKRIHTYVQIIILSGISYILIASLTTPTKGGVQNFGLRYLETGLFPVLIGLIYGIDFVVKESHKFKKVGIILLVILSLQPSVKFIKVGIKTLWSNSKWYSQMMKHFNKVGNSYIIHDSLNTAYLVGTSFLNQKHIYVGNDEKMKEIEKLFQKKDILSFMIISFEGNPYVSINVPKELYSRIYSKLHFKPKYYKKSGEEKLFHFKMIYYEKI